MRAHFRHRLVSFGAALCFAGLLTSATAASGASASTGTSQQSGGCPTGWTCADIGGPLPAGGQSVSDGVWTVTGGGGDIWGTSDAFHYAYNSMPADGTLSAEVTSQTDTDEWAKAGVMLRATSDPGSAYYAAFITPSNGVAVQWRTAEGATSNQLLASGTTPLYLEVARFTDTSTSTTYYTAYTSTDGKTWTAVTGSTEALSMPGALLAGLAVTSHDQGTAGQAVFQTVHLTSNELPPPTYCPTSWSCADIGGALPAGTQALRNGTWTITGGGGDIWSTADAFHYVWESMPADGTVAAHVTSQTDTNAWAKAGVMIRASTDPGSPYYAAFVTPSSGVAVQWRATEDATSNQIVASGSAPLYVRVARYADTANSTTYFTAYTSTDGKTWTAVVGSTEALSITGTVLAGMALTSHDQGTAGEATFKSAEITDQNIPPPTLCPPGWTCADVGGATPPGTQQVKAGVWTIQGGGGDIWGTADEFHFLAHHVKAPASMTADVTSQSDTDAWAKAGVMLRTSTNAGAPYYAVFLTPGNGVAVQWRASEGASSNQVLTAGTAPVYLRVAASGTTFTAYTSSDGTTWTAVPGSTISIAAMSGSLLAGLAVTSHSTSELSTATFTALAST